MEKRGKKFLSLFILFSILILLTPVSYAFFDDVVCFISENLAGQFGWDCDSDDESHIGCYREGNTQDRVDSRTLQCNEFGMFYAGNEVYNEDPDRFENNDDGKNACECIVGAAWDPLVFQGINDPDADPELIESVAGMGASPCCGDDATDDTCTMFEPQDDPDISKVFCLECSLGYIPPEMREWAGRPVGLSIGENRCCGDDENDCGSMSHSSLCWPGEEKWKFEQASDHKSQILKTGCNDCEFLSNGEHWASCCPDNEEYIAFDGEMNPLEGVENPFLIETDYLCKEAQIYECCGSSLSNCKSQTNAGVKAQTGYPALNVGEIIYYCASDMDWTEDLDVKDEETCAAYGFDWTGSKCCSEADDNIGDHREYYNDLQSGCWDSRLVLSGDYPLNDSKAVINYKGMFYGCRLESEKYTNNTARLLELKDQHTGQQLIEDKNYCDTLEDNSLYCSYTEEWIPLTTEFLSQGIHLSMFPGNASEQGGCCVPDKCWDGTQCIEDQANDPSSAPIQNYRCIGGEWNVSYLVEGPEIPGKPVETGYCPNAGQCLWNVLGDAEDNTNTSGNPQCIDSGQYIEDYYCEDGKWSSRTKWLAVEMLSLRGSDYSLFCGKIDDVLNFFDYIINSRTVRSLITSGENNYCVLSTNDKIIVGTSLNKDLDSDFMGIMGISSCNVADDGKFHTCNANNNVWYNKKTKIVIFSRSPFTISDINTEEIFKSEIQNPIDNLLNKLENGISTAFDPDIFIERLNEYRFLFLSRKGTKSIMGAMDGINYKNLVVEYDNFNTDLCSIINYYAKYNNEETAGIKCVKENNYYYVLAQGSIFSNADPSNIWDDLTSNLRLE